MNRAFCGVAFSLSQLLFVFVVGCDYGTIDSATGITLSEKAFESANSQGPDAVSFSEAASSIAVIPFVEDLSSGIGEQPIYLQVSMMGLAGSAEHWVSLVTDLVELRKVSDGERVPCSVRFDRSFVRGVATVGVIEIVPDGNLSDSEWYEILIPELPNAYLDVNGSSGRYLTGAASWRSRFSFGHDLRIRSIEVARDSLSVKMSESMMAYDDLPDVGVFQGEGKSLCRSVVPADHWRSVGSYRIDCTCDHVDLTSPISIRLSGTGHFGGMSEYSKSLVNLSVDLVPEEAESSDSSLLYVPEIRY